MASPNVYPNAFNTTGPGITALVGNYFSGNVLWVDSTSLVASDANAGTEPELPKATWTSAYAAASSGDVILCQPGHAETIAASNNLAVGNVATIGLGSGGQRAKFTSAVVGQMWIMGAAGLFFQNLYFPASTAATTARLSNSAASPDSYIGGCYFEGGANDATCCVSIAGPRSYVRDCDFVAVASRPARAIQMGSAVASCTFENVSINGGSYGWSSPAFNITAAATLLTLRDIRLLGRSDLVVTSTGCTYKMFGVRPTDNNGGRIVIAS